MKLGTLQESESSDMKTKSYQKRLQDIVYQHVSRSIFKADRLSFALHLVNKMHSQLVPENVSFKRYTYLPYSQSWWVKLLSILFVK